MLPQLRLINPALGILAARLSKLVVFFWLLAYSVKCFSPHRKLHIWAWFSGRGVSRSTPFHLPRGRSISGPRGVRCSHCRWSRQGARHSGAPLDQTSPPPRLSWSPQYTSHISVVVSITEKWYDIQSWMWEWTVWCPWGREALSFKGTNVQSFRQKEEAPYI